MAKIIAPRGGLHFSLEDFKIEGGKISLSEELFPTEKGFVPDFYNVEINIDTIKKLGGVFDSGKWSLDLQYPKVLRFVEKFETKPLTRGDAVPASYKNTFDYKNKKINVVITLPEGSLETTKFESMSILLIGYDSLWGESLRVYDV